MEKHRLYSRKTFYEIATCKKYDFSISVADPQHFRKVVLWLEDQKIREYDIQDRKDLRDMKSEYWPKAFAKYCNDTQCPIFDDDVDQLEWLIGYAIWLDANNNSKYFLTNGIKDSIHYYLNSVALNCD